jgi:hypothetical protein
MSEQHVLVASHQDGILVLSAIEHRSDHIPITRRGPRPAGEVLVGPLRTSDRALLGVSLYVTLRSTG